MGDNEKPWHERKKALDKVKQRLEREEPRQPDCHEFNKLYAEYKERESKVGTHGMMQLVHSMHSQHDPYISNPTDPLLKKVRDASEDYGRKLAKFFRESGNSLSANDIVILSQGLFAHRFYGLMNQNLEGFIGTLSSASHKSLEIDVLQVTEGVEHEEGELGLTFSVEWKHEKGVRYSFDMPNAIPSYEGNITVLEYSLKDSQAIRIEVKKHVVTQIDSNSREEQKPEKVSGAIRIPLIHILGDNIAGFGEVRKYPQIIVRYAGVVIYQQPEERTPQISQGKGKPPVDVRTESDMPPVHRSGRHLDTLLLE